MCFAEISAKCQYVGKYYGRWVVNLFIFESRIVRFIPNNLADTLSPLIFQLVNSKVLKLFSNSRGEQKIKDQNFV